MADGSTIKLPDIGESCLEWDLEFAALTDAEASSLEQFFKDCEGSLETFSFLDPLGNLLAWSEKLDEPIWEQDALISISGGVADPWGGDRAFGLSNTTPVNRGIQQVVNTPGWFEYCFTFWARSSSPQAIDIIIGGSVKTRFIGTRWERVSSTANPGTEDESVIFRVDIHPGDSVELFAMQAEAQPAASHYKRTGPAGGIFPSARFRDSVLRMSDEGINHHSCRVSIISNANTL
jgi:hypothetical protein